MQGSDCQVAVLRGSPRGGGWGVFPLRSDRTRESVGGGPTVLVSQNLQLSRGFAETGEKTRAPAW